MALWANAKDKETIFLFVLRVKRSFILNVLNRTLTILAAKKKLLNFLIFAREMCYVVLKTFFYGS